MRQLVIKAGPKALKTILERGLRQEDVSIVAAAAGGPRWLILYELDKFIFGDWLLNKHKAIDYIGASAGAWRMACAVQDQPVQALEKLYHYYVHQRYPEMPDPKEVSDKCRVIIQQLLGKTGANEILNSPNKRLHVLTNIAKFDYARKSLKFNLLKTALGNLFSRKNLNRYFDRCVFSTRNEALIDTPKDHMTTRHKSLNGQNIENALLASGAIPTVIEPIFNIIGEEEVHFDGGLIDYHLDIPYKNPSEGLVLYPHFMSRIIPGWLDKHLFYRKTEKAYHENTVLIYPSEDFIQSLPRKQIPARQDFKFYFQRDDERIAYWQDITERSKVLVKEFQKLLALDSLEGHVVPL